MKLISGGVHKAPSLQSGGVLLARGAAYCRIILGQDLAAAYVGLEGDGYRFNLVESLALLARTPESCCLLSEEESKG